MANGHGGMRVGSGRKKKPLTEKILDGNPGKRPLTVIEFPEGYDLSVELEPPAYLADASRNSGNWPSADKIFKDVSDWLKKTGCLHLISSEHISDYSLLKARFLECEAMNAKHGLLAKHPVSGQPIASPYVRMGIDYLKAADVTWSKIWAVVSGNSTVDLGSDNPNDDMMEKLLTKKR